MTAPKNQQAAFLAAIHDHPDDDGPRLRFANWLEERGDPRSEFIRVQCALACLDEDDPRREELERREEQLLRQHGEAWRGSPPKGVEVVFERGLPSFQVGAEALDRDRTSQWFTAHQSWVSTLNIRGLVTDAGLEHLAGLAQLRKLYLGCNLVTAAGLKHLAGLTQLRVLYLHLQGKGAGLEHLAGLPQLRELGLHGRKVTGAGLKHLAELSRLQELCLDDTRVTDVGLEHLAGLTQLRELDLCYTQVRGAGLEHLAGLTQLQKLYLFVTRVTEAGLKKLKKALPRCHITRH